MGSRERKIMTRMSGLLQQLPKNKSEIIMWLLGIPEELRCNSIDDYVNKMTIWQKKTGLNGFSHIKSIHGSGYIFTVSTEKEHRMELVASYIDPEMWLSPLKVIVILKSYSKIEPLVFPKKSVLYAVLRSRFHFGDDDMNALNQLTYTTAK